MDTSFGGSVQPPTPAHIIHSQFKMLAQGLRVYRLKRVWRPLESCGARGLPHKQTESSRKVGCLGITHSAFRRGHVKAWGVGRFTTNPDAIKQSTRSLPRGIRRQVRQRKGGPQSTGWRWEHFNSSQTLVSCSWERTPCKCSLGLFGYTYICTFKHICVYLNI